MKKIIVAATLLAFIGFPCCLWAQDEKPEKKEATEKKQKKEKAGEWDKKQTEEIVIRNKGDKDMNLKVEIKGDKIIVNGKPLAEFKDDQVTINKRKMIIRDGDRTMAVDFGPDSRTFNMGQDFMKQWGGKENGGAFLGVTTERTEEGARVTDVTKGSAAEKAGLKKDDIITKVGDDAITDSESLSELIANKKAKEIVKIAYKRDGKEGSLKATLGQRKTGSMAFSYNGPDAKMRAFSMPKISGDLGGLNDMEEMSSAGNYFAPYASFPRQKKLGLKIQDTEEGDNVKIIDVEAGSAADKAGLKKDDIILEIGGNKVASTDDAREQLNPEEQKTSYPMKIKRNGTEMSVDVKIPKKVKTANL